VDFNTPGALRRQHTTFPLLKIQGDVESFLPGH
jgi:hypothetical protein